MKYLVRTIVVSVLVFPVFAGAQSNADISTQAQILLQQIMDLQAQLGVGSASSGGATSGACYSGGPVKPGTTSANVTALQQFLARDPNVYPEAKVTGYFGGLTQAAVGRWQAKNGIVSSGSPATTGFGTVGPRTAAAMAASCGGGGADSGDPTVGGFIKVSPINGDSPLTVNAEATINTTKSCLAATYTLNWGDKSQPVSISIPANKCDVLAQTYSHTYTSGGSFTVSLSSGGHESTVTVGVNGPVSSNTTGTTGSTGSTVTGTTGATGGNQTASGAFTISIDASGFSPSTVTINSGTKVTWTNKDSTNHTVTADNNSFNSGPLTPGQSYSPKEFVAKGEYTYYCTYHGGPGGSGMSGKIIVQ